MVTSWRTTLKTVAVFLALINLAAIDVFLFQQNSGNLLPVAENIGQSSPKQSSPVGGCGEACVARIYEAIASVSAAIPTPAPTTKPTKQAKETTQSSVKEFYIPLGTGSTTNNNWEDVAGAETTVDPANYGSIKEARFEAGLRLPVANGTVYARLFNVTDKHPVWFSEVSSGVGASTLVISPAMTLDPGSKTYRVQIKSSLQYPAYMDSSRIKITVK